MALFVFLGRLTAFTAKVVGGLSAVRGRPLIRVGLANLHRPGAPTTTLVLVMGICLVLVISIVNLHRNAERYLSVSLPNSAPTIVLLNINPVAGPRFDSYLQARSQVARWMRAPFLQAKITTLNGRAVADLRIPAEAAFIIRGDRGISWQQHQPTTNLTAGKWWPADYVGPPLASLDEWAAGRLGIGIGDTLTLSIEGKPLKQGLPTYVMSRVPRSTLISQFFSHRFLNHHHTKRSGQYGLDLKPDRTSSKIYATIYHVHSRTHQRSSSRT